MIVSTFPVRWTVSSDPVGCGRRFWFYVYVYETNAELQRAAAQYRDNDQGTDWSGCAGCFQPRLAIHVPEGTERLSDVPMGKRRPSKNTPFLGVMRLSMQQLTVDTIIHESAHAAVNYVNSLYLIAGYRLGHNEIRKQEALCYAAGEFAHALLKKAELLR